MIKKCFFNNLIFTQSGKNKFFEGYALLIFLIIPFLASAQETPQLINYPNTIYKAHNQNWEISQSKDNIIYAANSDGLLEYDGAVWKLYPLPNRQIIRTVLCDTTVNGDSRVYVGGFSEFGYWQKTGKGQLIYHSLSQSTNFKSLKTEEIWHITKTTDAIYFQSFARVYKYDGRKITELKSSGNFMFIRNVRNRLFFHMLTKGLYELKNNKFLPLPGSSALANAVVSDILPFSDNRLLITTTKHGLFLYDFEKLTEWKIPVSEELKKNIINKALILSSDSSLALGTILKGLYILDKNGNLKYHFKKENGLQNNTVLSLGEDSRKHLWLGMDQGIDLIKLSSPIISYQTIDNPLGSTYAAAIWKDKLYVGSNNGVFVKKWPSAEPFRAIPGLEGQTWNLRVVDDQLLCGHNDATFRIEENGIKRISSVTGGWVFLPVQTKKEKLLLQGSYTGLHAYRKDNKGYWVYAFAVKGIPPIPIKQIVRTKDGSLWLAHAYKGLFRTVLNENMDSAKTWQEYKSPIDIPSEFAIEITPWQPNILVHSGNGFFQPNDENKLMPYLNLKNNDGDAFKIRTGIQGDWFKVYLNKIFLINNNDTRSLDLSLLRNNETIIPLSAQYYFFGLDNGYALYDRTIAEKPMTAAMTPVIRRVMNLRNLAEMFETKSNTILPKKVRSIRIMYALPVFGQNIQYKYRLKGLSEQWSEWTEQSYVEYTNLESREYTFEVKSNLNEQVTIYRFSVNPFWYETVWAKLLFVLLAAATLTGIIFYQEKRLISHRKKLLEEQEEKLRQQTLVNERRIIEIRNENLQSEIKNKSQQLSNVAINVVRKNEILQEIRDELQQVKQELGQQLPNIHYQKLLHSIERNVAGKDDWVLFEENFNEIHDEFFKRLKKTCPEISPSELRLAACLRMNLSSKEMAPVLGISLRGIEIKRYRLRKKLHLSNDFNLNEYMMEI
ncbi:triple tyrosine motif-containing protein [Dyadobacter sp. CY356]|uniref:triple tyrosine motif-containing protein n=1 Tax=Dyadobacter sp. CY356 TaxID=2906442 RepID=UPI001F3A5695|nr:triple tyrosine motif-containing protein [Dyadobacter sp. CY356]MCF0056894.1 LuxR family transcriptional regulator [Dyadobacter sp. CY356]